MSSRSKGILYVFFLAVFTIVGCSSSAPVLGITDGKLTDCPSSPNCVNSQQEDSERHSIAPLAVGGDRSAVLPLIAKKIESMGGTITELQPNYLHAQFSSAVFGFIDDVEFLLTQRTKDEKNIVEVRSAARTGYYDFNVNRKRIEKIRAALAN